MRRAGVGAETRLGAEEHLAEVRLVRCVAAAQPGAHEGAQQADRHAGQRWIQDREQGVGAHEGRTAERQPHRRDQSRSDSADHARRIEAPPEEREHDDREVGRRGNRDGQDDQHAHVDALREQAQSDREGADPEGRCFGHAHLLLLRDVAALENVDVQIMGDGTGGRKREPRDHREDRREGDRTDRREEDLAAQRTGAAAEVLREQRQREVAALVSRADCVLSHEGGGGEANQRGDQKEAAGEEHQPDHRAPRRRPVRNGEKAGHDVRKAGDAEHE